MAIEIRMPALSPTMEEGTLAKWLVKVGDEISSGDIMAEIETDKATMEFEAVDEGVLAAIVVEEGSENVAVGTVIAILAEEGEDVADVTVPAKDGADASDDAADNEGSDSKSDEKTGADTGGSGSTPAPEQAPTSSDGPRATPLARRIAEASGTDLATIEGTGARGKITKADVEGAGSGDGRAPASGDRVIASPLARKLAGDQGIDLADLSGSGPGGRIIKADIDNYEPSASPAPAAAASEKADKPAAATAAPKPASEYDAPFEEQKLNNVRKVIARRLTEAKQQVPHIYLTVDIRLDALLDLRKQLNASLEADGVKLSVNDLIIKALARALQREPQCNVSFQGDVMHQYTRQDISVAVAAPSGLITPIIRDAGKKGLAEISNEMKELAAKAREGKLQPHEYQGGTASLSNLGMFGTKQFDAVINPPQGMILAVGAGEQRPYVVDGELTVATVMSATGSFDHRAIDGVDGAKLMDQLRSLLENPMGLVV